jgi:ribosomal protein L20A (L18A)
MKSKYVFRVFGWEVSIQNIKAYEKFAKEYDEAVEEHCREQEYDDYLRDIYEAEHQ